MQNVVVVTLKAQSNMVSSFPKQATSRIKTGSRNVPEGVPSEVGVAPIECKKRIGHNIMQCVCACMCVCEREGEGWDETVQTIHVSQSSLQLA